ncbi:unnamed protein product [Boreogadus saida]
MLWRNWADETSVSCPPRRNTPHPREGKHSNHCVPFYTTSASGGTFHSQTMMMMMMAINMTRNLAVWNRVDRHLGITLKTHFR